MKINLSLRSIFRESWQNVHGIKSVVTFYLLLPIIVFFALVLLSYIATPNLSVTWQQGLVVGLAQLFIIAVISIITMWYGVFANVIAGVNNVLSLPTGIKNSWRTLNAAKGKVIALLVFIFILSFAYLIIRQNIYQHVEFSPMLMSGIYILVIALLYLSLFALLAFVLPLTVLKQQPFFYAVKLAFIALYHNWLKILLSMVLMLILLAISIIPLGIGLFWTMPMWYAMHGVFYREIFQPALKQ